MPRKTFAGLFLFGAVLASAFGQNPPSGLPEELIAADRGVWEAIAGSHPNMELVNSVLAPDYIDIDSGVVSPREEVLQYLRGLTRFSFQYGHAKAYLLSPTSGYVVAQLSYSSVQNGKPATGKVLTTTVFNQVHGRWIAHLHTEMDLKPGHDEHAAAPGAVAP